MSAPVNHGRRRLVQGLGLASLLAAGGWTLARPTLARPTLARPTLVNPCRAALPRGLAASPWLASAWEGVDPQQVWDCHAHIAGTGDGGSGIEVGPQLNSLWRPLQYAQRLFYMNAGCAHDTPGRVDASYVERLLNLMDAMPAGVKLMLFAFESFHDEAGRPQTERTAFHVPDAYARQLAQANPERFEWVASIHPYRPDALDALETAVATGARAVKWLPAAMGMDPASARCDAFYRALVRHGLPLIVHCGEEKAVKGGDSQAYGNPLRLRQALAAGVRVVVAHCATLGHDIDLDGGPNAKALPSFELFARLLAEPAGRGLLYGDISAITQRNRAPALIKTLLERSDWHDRLLNGSDYPLPGILPLISPATLAREGLLPSAAVADLETLREHNPLLFDFTLKRLLSWQGKRFPAAVFETRRFFAPGLSGGSK